MKPFLLGRPSFNDWSRALDAVASASNGQIHLRDFDDVDEVLSYARRFRLQGVVPMTYPQMRMIAKHKGRFAQAGIKAICSDQYELVENFDDKVRFIRFMEEQDLMHLLPEVYVVQHDGQRIDYAPVQYPCIFKLAVTFGGTGSTVHLDPQRPLQLEQVAKNVSYIVQAFVPGNVEFGGHFYVEGGAVRKQAFYRCTRDASMLVQRGRMPNFTRLEDLDEASELESMFGAVNYTGFACVDFKVTRDGIKIFEVNPRLGGSLMHNGPDLMSFFETALED